MNTKCKGIFYSGGCDRIETIFHKKKDRINLKIVYKTFQDQDQLWSLKHAHHVSSVHASKVIGGWSEVFIGEK